MVHALLPKRFNPQTLADHQQTLAGELSTDSMARLQEAVISIDPTVSVDLQVADARFGYRIDGKIVCTLGLYCVRCLGEVRIRVSPNVRLVVRPRLESPIEVPEGYDPYEYEGSSLELSHLIEDELLLALPLVPRHVDISLCDSGMVAWLDSKERASGPARNPFAVLKRP